MVFRRNLVSRWLDWIMMNLVVESFLCLPYGIRKLKHLDSYRSNPKSRRLLIINLLFYKTAEPIAKILLTEE